jgi:hypothetical protein
VLGGLSEESGEAESLSAGGGYFSSTHGKKGKTLAHKRGARENRREKTRPDIAVPSASICLGLAWDFINRMILESCKRRSAAVENR